MIITKKIINKRNCYFSTSVNTAPLVVLFDFKEIVDSVNFINVIINTRDYCISFFINHTPFGFFCARIVPLSKKHKSSYINGITI